MHPPLTQQLLRQASAPYRHAGQFDFGWARGKLKHDPIFAALIELRLLPDGARVLDLGCGRGLLAAWFLAAEQLAAAGRWHDNMPRPPRGLRFRGVELMAREAETGQRVLQAQHGERVQLRGGDMRTADLSDVDVIAMLDVLHYIPYADQDRLLDRIRAALPPGGLFITRVGDAAGGLFFRISQWVDRCMSFAQGHRLGRMWCRPVSEWTLALAQRGFSVEARHMSAGTPFANVMLVARVP
jgi:cyclopropane fatty-acyl-phospholipid synthase-like methyltransferase